MPTPEHVDSEIGSRLNLPPPQDNHPAGPTTDADTSQYQMASYSGSVLARRVSLALTPQGRATYRESVPEGGSRTTVLYCTLEMVLNLLKSLVSRIGLGVGERVLGVGERVLGGSVRFLTKFSFVQSSVGLGFFLGRGFWAALAAAIPPALPARVRFPPSRMNSRASR